MTETPTIHAKADCPTGGVVSVRHSECDGTGYDTDVLGRPIEDCSCDHGTLVEDCGWCDDDDEDDTITAVTVPFPRGMSVGVEAPGFTLSVGRDGIRITPNEGVHVTTVTNDTTGYGHDTWVCSCGVVNASQFGGTFPIEDHTAGAIQVRVDTYNEED